ncbi:MAG: M1 family metallopeptidase [Ilumatobacteraceae bacterium]
MRRLALLAVAVATAAACASSGVRSESARQQAAPSTTGAAEPQPTPEPEPTEPAPTEPEPTDPQTTDPTEPDPPPPSSPPTSDDEPITTEVAEGQESIGDDMFPELGTDDLDVQSYDVRLSYDPATMLIDGGVTLAATPDGPVERIVLDAVDLDIEAVTVDGAAAEFELGADELVITPATPPLELAPITIDVQYTAEAAVADVEAGIFGLGWFATPDGSYVLNQPDGARNWLPSNDHPSDKALWRFELTVPTGTTAVANGELMEQRSGPDGDTWVWEQREAMATYLVQVLTGDYEILERGSVSGVAIVDVALAEDVERMEPYFDLTDDQLAFFEPLFGPYPLDRYGLAFTDSFPGLAMETQGRSLYSRDDFPGGRVGFVEHLLLSHELAHMWFGDAVTPADWSDLWLNESFATYGEWLWLDHVGLATLEAQAEDGLVQRRNFAESTGDPGSVENLFGFERYGGGAVVVHALRLDIGDDLFFTLLQRWVADNTGTSRTTEDFIALANEVAGRDLTNFFDSWLFAEQLPEQYPS